MPPRLPASAPRSGCTRSPAERRRPTSCAVSPYSTPRPSSSSRRLSDGDILRFLADVEPLFINASALQELPNFEERTKELMAMQVRDIAKKQVISVGAEMELGEVCQILTENHIKKAPVLENGKMIGIINMSNITKYVLRKMM